MKPNRILLLTHALEFSGAPLAVFEAAMTLEKRGYKTHTISLSDGILSEKYEQNNLSFSIYNDDESFIQATTDFDFIICSSLETARHVQLLQSAVPHFPIAWWIQEKLEYTSNQPQIIEQVNHAPSIFTSSPLSQMEYLPYNPTTYLIPYGIEDHYQEKKMQLDFLSFALIGTIIPKKGHDIFIQAIERLPAHVRERAGFFIIGNAPNLPALQQIEKRIETTPEISILPPTTSFQELCEYYEGINALIVPSREEATSRVTIEAMMMGRPVIMSDAVGAQYLLQDGVNGFRFKSEDIDGLSAILKRVIENPQILEKMQTPAREAFLKHNSMEAFGNALEKAIIEEYQKQKSK